MKYPFYAFLSSVFFLMTAQSIAQKPSFTFADTYPTSNLDSLENWVKAHTQPNEERLKNLIKLERSYYWFNLFKLGSFEREIAQITKSSRSPVGTAGHLYLKALFHNARNEAAPSVHYANDALKQFENSKPQDASGILHCYAVFILNNSTVFGNQVVSDPKFSTGYVKKMNDLLAQTNSLHDRLMVKLAYTRYLYGQGGNGVTQLRPTAEQALQLIHTQPVGGYATYRFERLRAIGFKIQGNIPQSYRINKQLLATLHPSQAYETATVGYNLAVDCYSLKRNQEGIEQCQKSIGILREYPPFWFVIAGPFTKYRELAAAQGNYQLANELADSVSKYNALVFSAENDKKMLELQGRFEFDRNQAQIQTLEQNAQRNRIFLIIAVVVAAALGFLGWKLRQSNTRLNALVLLRDEFIRIIAHDLRRPLHAFYGLSEVFSKLLQRGDQQAIVKISRSIDQSGLYIRQMLDNLLYWALSQKGKLTLTPTTFSLQSQLAALVSVYGAVTALKGISLEYDCPHDLTVHTDVNALDLILRNLIDNAIQQTPDQGNIRIEAKPVADSDRVFIRLSDTGKGMTQTQLQLVRDVLATPKRFQPKQENLGLGLIIVSTFAQQAGILISVDSQEGKGATFEISLKTEK